MFDAKHTARNEPFNISEKMRKQLREHSQTIPYRPLKRVFFAPDTFRKFAIHVGFLRLRAIF